MWRCGGGGSKALLCWNVVFGAVVCVGLVSRAVVCAGVVFAAVACTPMVCGLWYARLWCWVPWCGSVGLWMKTPAITPRLRIPAPPLDNHLKCGLHHVFFVSIFEELRLISEC